MNRTVSLNSQSLSRLLEYLLWTSIPLLSFMCKYSCVDYCRIYLHFSVIVGIIVSERQEKERDLFKASSFIKRATLFSHSFFCCPPFVILY